MSNTLLQRVENSYMPPKKFAWRSANINSSELSLSSVSASEAQHLFSTEENTHKMGCDLKRTEKIERPPRVEPVSPVTEQPPVDQPLDFSLKTSCSPSGSSRSHHHESTWKIGNPWQKPLSPNLLPKESNSVISTSPVAFPGMPISINPPFNFMNNSSSSFLCSESQAELINNSHLVWHNTENNSAKIDTSRCSNERTLASTSKENGINSKISCNKSPEQSSREDSPHSPPNSLLKEMLCHRQIETNINGPLATTFSNQLNFQDGMIGSPSPPRQSPGAIVHPASSILPVPVSPYYAFGYNLVSRFLPHFPDSNISDISATRQQKRKKTNLVDPLKSLSVEELHKKLLSIQSGNPFMCGTDYSLYAASNSSPPSDQGVSTTGTLEPMKTEINLGVTNGTSNTSNVPSIDDNNDSVTSAMADSDKTATSADSRKRKTIDDSEKDAAYWNKRNKNNLAAKKSRENRRLKEQLVREAATTYEMQNRQLLAAVKEITIQRAEMEARFVAVVKEYDNLKIQNTVLLERLNQKRCGQCGATLPNLN